MVESSSQTSASVHTATALSHPEPYHDGDNEAHHGKDEERRYRDLAAVASVPRKIALAATLNVGDSNLERDETCTSDAVASETLCSSEKSPLHSNLQYQTGLVTATPIHALMVAEAVQVTIDEESGDGGGNVAASE